MQHKFNPANLFPLWREGEFTYLQAQAHSADVDDWFGLKIAAIESELMVTGCRRRAPQAHNEKQQLWIGLAAKSLLTPYTEIRRTLELLNLPNGSHVVDLGAAYGRMGFVIGKCYADFQFTGYEYVGERVVEANRCLAKHRITNAKVEHADLSAPSFRLAPADVYFIYDYGTERAIEKTLYDLKRIAQQRKIIIVARGVACHKAIEQRHRWLKLLRGNEAEAKSSIYVFDPCATTSVSIDSLASL